MRSVDDPGQRIERLRPPATVGQALEPDGERERRCDAAGEREGQGRVDASAKPATEASSSTICTL